jgi:hypothetical protein
MDETRDDRDDDGDDIATAGGWILTAAVVAVLAVGASMAAHNREANRAAAPPPPAAGSPAPGANAKAGTGVKAAVPVGAPARQANARGLDAPPCTHLTSLKSADGLYVLEYAVSASGSTQCLMQEGDRGAQVSGLQRALTACAGQSLASNGTFTASTASALSRVQLVKGGAGDGIYGPNTARVLGWPWRYASSGDLTGRCSPAGVQA